MRGDKCHPGELVIPQERCLLGSSEIDFRLTCSVGIPLFPLGGGSMNWGDIDWGRSERFVQTSKGTNISREWDYLQKLRQCNVFRSQTKLLGWRTCLVGQRRLEDSWKNLPTNWHNWKIGRWETSQMVWILEREFTFLEHVLFAGQLNKHEFIPFSP